MSNTSAVIFGNEQKEFFFFKVITSQGTEFHGICWAGNEHTCTASEHKLVMGSCRGSKANNPQMLTQNKNKIKKKNQHLHDDGFLGHFSLLFSDYKENSMNSMGLKRGKS